MDIRYEINKGFLEIFAIEKRCKERGVTTAVDMRRIDLILGRLEKL